MSHLAKDPLSGHPGHLDPGQQHALEKFRAEITAEGLYHGPDEFDDAYLLRFLRARKFDLAKTKIMWTDHINWRKEYGVDNLYENFDYPEYEAVSKIYPKFYHKTDIDGRPVYIEILGKIDVTKLFQVTTADRQLQKLVVEYEKFLRDRLPICSEVQGKLIETSCTILDLKDVGVSQFWKVKNIVQSATAVSSNNYPETMGKFYIINAPWAFTTVWSFVKPLLDEVTVSKIQILSSDWMKTVGKQIPIQNIPKFMGGGCECPGGCALSDAGPWQDKELVERVKVKQQQHKQVAGGAPAKQSLEGQMGQMNLNGAAQVQSDATTAAVSDTTVASQAPGSPGKKRLSIGSIRKSFESGKGAAAKQK